MMTGGLLFFVAPLANLILVVLWFETRKDGRR